jgi:hypothetical protein
MGHPSFPRHDLFESYFQLAFLLSELSVTATGTALRGLALFSRAIARKLLQ